MVDETRQKKSGGWRQTLLASLLATAAVWVLFTWPLAGHLTSAIPYVPLRPDETPRFARFHACDPLQLVYHFWLAGDMVSGSTRPFYNLYEFNTGNDEERYVPGTYYIPFSLLYALGETLGGRAFGLNLIGIVALWLTFLFTLMLTRRYVKSEGWAIVCAILPLIIPYRWHALIGGSPAGLAMAWVPLVFYGLDVAVREQCMRGGLLAGLGVFLCCVGDSHVFFFTVLMVPAWCILASLQSNAPWPWRGRVMVGWVRSLWPFVVLLGAAYLMNKHQSLAVAGGGVTESRSAHEVRLCSPSWEGLFFHHFNALDNQIYLGWVIPVLGLLTLSVAAVAVWRRMLPLWRPTLTLAFLAGLTAFVAILSLGYRGPATDVIYENARTWIPFFGLIRQPAKFFVVMPSLLAVLLAVLGSLAASTVRRRAWLAAVATLVSLVIGVEYRSRTDPGLFVLPREQGAYRLIAKDAASRGVDPHAVVVTFWPGDSHETTVFEYYASLYRIRLVNGYRPFVDPAYRAFYDRFSSVNQGFLSDAQVNELLERGIDYVLLHEDRYPTKVSPFSVTFAIRSLMESPRLDLLCHFDDVWAFRLRKTPEPRQAVGTNWSFHAAATHWEAERKSEGCDVVDDSDASGGRYLVVGEDDKIHFGPVQLGSERDVGVFVRLRGTGLVSMACLSNEGCEVVLPSSIKSHDWTWVKIPLSDRLGFSRVSFDLEVESGSLDVDLAMLTAGDWQWGLPVNEKVWLPAAGFLHSGRLNEERGSLILVPDGRTGDMMNGPNLPVAPGRYRATLDFRHNGTRDAALGQWRVSSRGTDLATLNLGGATTEALVWDQPSDLPFTLRFDYSGTTPMEIDGVWLERLPQ